VRSMRDEGRRRARAWYRHVVVGTPRPGPQARIAHSRRSLQPGVELLQHPVALGPTVKRYISHASSTPDKW